MVVKMKNIQDDKKWISLKVKKSKNGIITKNLDDNKDYKLLDC